MNGDVVKTFSRMRSVFAALLLAMNGSVSRAAEPLMPSPAGPPADIADQVAAYRPSDADRSQFARFFYFHKVGINPDIASADFRECLDYASSVVLFPVTPDHLPTTGSAGTPEAAGPWGLTGVVIAGLLIPGQTRELASANLRRCMNFKSYRRYGLSKTIWQGLNQGPVNAVLRANATVAAGSAPAGESLAP